MSHIFWETFWIANSLLLWMTATSLEPTTTGKEQYLGICFCLPNYATLHSKATKKKIRSGKDSQSEQRTTHTCRILPCTGWHTLLSWNKTLSILWEETHRSHLQNSDKVDFFKFKIFYKIKSEKNGMEKCHHVWLLWRGYFKRDDQQLRTLAKFLLLIPGIKGLKKTKESNMLQLATEICIVAFQHSSRHPCMLS